MSYKDFHIAECVGKGSFASVYKVIRRSDAKVYALKRVKIDKLSREEIGSVLNEIRFLASLQTNHIVRFFDAFLESEERELCMVMEYCGGGDLSHKIERYRKRKMWIEERVIWQYLHQALKALSALHKQGIVHRDIKPANCFLDEKGALKLGDLNVSKRLNTQGLLLTQVGTPYYMSPEMWNAKAYNASSDMWALGCLVYELAALKPPFSGRNITELRNSICMGKYSPIPAMYSQSLRKMIADLLRVNPHQRPTALSLLKCIISSTRSKSLRDDADTKITAEKENVLIETIKFPQNLRRLSENLPRACYPDCLPLIAGNLEPKASVVVEPSSNAALSLPPLARPRLLPLAL